MPHRRRDEAARRRKYRDRRLVAGHGRHTLHLTFGRLDPTCPDCMGPSTEPEPDTQGSTDAGTSRRDPVEGDTAP